MYLTITHWKHFNLAIDSKSTQATKAKASEALLKLNPNVFMEDYRVHTFYNEREELWESILFKKNERGMPVDRVLGVLRFNRKDAARAHVLLVLHAITLTEVAL